MHIVLLTWQMNQREMEVRNKVCSVALTDSAHNIWLQETTKSTQDWMLQVNQLTSHTVSNTHKCEVKVGKGAASHAGIRSDCHLMQILSVVCVGPAVISLLTALLTHTGNTDQPQTQKC